MSEDLIYGLTNKGGLLLPSVELYKTAFETAKEIITPFKEKCGVSYIIYLGYSRY